MNSYVRLIYKEQVSKKTRRINASGLFFCSICGNKYSDEKFKTFSKVVIVKDMGKISNIFENLIRLYVESGV